MSKKYYISFCSIDKEKYRDYLSPVPADLKTKYVCSKFHGDLSVISLSSYRKFKFGTRKKETFGNIRTLISFGGNTKIGRFLDGIIRKVYLFFFVKIVLKKNDTVIVYHSYKYTKFLARHINKKKIKAILEVEEIYGYNAIEDKPFLEDEINQIKAFDKFIFVNDYIPFELGIDPSRYVVSYGVINKPSARLEKKYDGFVHILYAGTIEEKKRGALYAVMSARYLPGNYVMHIAGFGNEKSVEKLKAVIEENNAEYSCKVVFHGMLKGDALNALMDRCHVGLSSNVIRPNFANNTFPSKTVTYMLHNLHIVSGYAEAFTKCKICNDWQYFYEQSPSSIADAIKKIEADKIADYDSLLDEIDNELIVFLKREQCI